MGNQGIKELERALGAFKVKVDGETETMGYYELFRNTRGSLRVAKALDAWADRQETEGNNTTGGDDR